MFCPACDKEVGHTIEIGQVGAEKRCEECSFLFKDEPVAAPIATPPAKRKTRATTRDASEPIDVVKEGKKRLRFVSREVKRLGKELAKFEKEQAQLERLLAAAETPVAAVTPIHRASKTK